MASKADIKDRATGVAPDFLGYTILVSLWAMLVVAIALLARFGAELQP